MRQILLILLTLALLACEKQSKQFHGEVKMSEPTTVVQSEDERRRIELEAQLAELELQQEAEEAAYRATFDERARAVEVMEAEKRVREVRRNAIRNSTKPKTPAPEDVDTFIEDNQFKEGPIMSPLKGCTDMRADQAKEGEDADC